MVAESSCPPMDDIVVMDSNTPTRAEEEKKWAEKAEEEEEEEVDKVVAASSTTCCGMPIWMAATKTTTVPGDLLPPTYTFFSRGCARSLVLALLTYILLLTLAALIAHVQRHIGLVLLSLIPGVAMMAYMQRLFVRSVLRREMVLTFFMTIIYMSPLVVLENAWYFAVVTHTHLEDQGSRKHTTQAITWGYLTLSSVVRAYVVAGLFEETAKYLALRRLQTLAYVTDPRALVTYGLCAGAAFGTVEDLFIYAFSYGIENTIARAFLSVPLHGMTGMLAGCALAEDRFVRPGSYPWYKVIALGGVVHGTFDFLNFMLADEFAVISVVLEVLLVVAGFAYARYWLVGLMTAFPEEDNVHARMDQPSALDATVLHEDEEDEEEAGVPPPPPPPPPLVVENGKEGKDLHPPTTKYILTVAGVGCFLCTGMLLFLYLWDF